MYRVAYSSQKFCRTLNGESAYIKRVLVGTIKLGSDTPFNKLLSGLTGIALIGLYNYITRAINVQKVAINEKQNELTEKIDNVTIKENEILKTIISNEEKILDSEHFKTSDVKTIYNEPAKTSDIKTIYNEPAKTSDIKTIYKRFGSSCSLKKKSSKKKKRNCGNEYKNK